MHRDTQGYVLSPFRVEQEQKCLMGHSETLIYELPFQSTAVSASEINQLAGLNAQILCAVCLRAGASGGKAGL